MANPRKPVPAKTSSSSGHLRLLVVGVGIIVVTQVPASRTWVLHRLNTVSTKISTTLVTSIKKELPPVSTPSTTTTLTTTVVSGG